MSEIRREGTKKSREIGAQSDEQSRRPKAQGTKRKTGASVPAKAGGGKKTAARKGASRRSKRRKKRVGYVWIGVSAAIVLLLILAAAMLALSSGGDRDAQTAVPPPLPAAEQTPAAPEEAVGEADPIAAEEEAAAPQEEMPETELPPEPQMPEETEPMPAPEITEEPAVLSGTTEEPAPSEDAGAEEEVTGWVDWSGWNDDDLFGVTSGSGVSAASEYRKATIRIAGDILIAEKMLDATYDKATDSYSFAPYFEYVGDTLSNADYTIINIEGSLYKGNRSYSGYPTFRTPPVILDAVKSVGVDMITMCNNHMLDSYCDGLVASVGLVDAAGLDHIGGYVDEADSEEPEIYEINGIKVGFVTYTHSANTMDKQSDSRAKFLVNFFRNADFDEDIRKAREAGAEVVVAVTHWGEEYKRKPESNTRAWAKQLVAAGADIIIGGHPHVVQPAEYVTAEDAQGNERTALCVYSMGNFLSRQQRKHTDSGIVFEFTIQENADGGFSITDPGYVPVFVWDFKNADGKEDLRVLPVGAYLDNPPPGMSSTQVKRMKESWNETLEVMKHSEVAQPLDE